MSHAVLLHVHEVDYSRDFFISGNVCQVEKYSPENGIESSLSLVIYSSIFHSTRIYVDVYSGVDASMLCVRNYLLDLFTLSPLLGRS